MTRKYPFKLLPLEYEENSFDPQFLSKEVFQFHRGKHHLGYINKLNSLLEGEYKKLQHLPLEEIITESRNLGLQNLFNNAGQTFNHDLYWQCLSPEKHDGRGTKLYSKIIDDYGSWTAFAEHFLQKSLQQFGSGWSWLCMASGKLEVITTSNADLPTGDHLPIMVCDLWEHAYYITFRNDRATYVQRTLEEFLNWPAMELRYLKSLSPK